MENDGAISVDNACSGSLERRCELGRVDRAAECTRLYGSRHLQCVSFRERRVHAALDERIPGNSRQYASGRRGCRASTGGSSRPGHYDRRLSTRGIPLFTAHARSGSPHPVPDRHRSADAASFESRLPADISGVAPRATTRTRFATGANFRRGSCNQLDFPSGIRYRAEVP